MDFSPEKWLSELDMEDPNFVEEEYHMNPFDCPLDDFNCQPFSSYPTFDAIDNVRSSPTSVKKNDTDKRSFVETIPTLVVKRPAKQLKTENYKATNYKTCSSSKIICFEKSSSSSPASTASPAAVDCTFEAKINEIRSNGNMGLSSFAAPYADNRKKVGGNAQLEHVLAERKRREKLTERFIALSAIIPGLEKMNKASVLGDAIKYIKQLQEQVKMLEEQAAKKTIESSVIVKKCQLTSDVDDSSLLGENSDTHLDQTTLEIEARFSEKDVLIRIHCEKRKGILAKILNEVEINRLNVINYSLLPFGDSTLDISLVAQMEDEFGMTMKDFVRNLQQALLSS